MPPITPLLARDDENKSIANSSYLIIDDFSGIRTMLSGILRSAGVQPRAIDFAADGREALSQLNAKRYDVVLCDHNLGTGQNGMQVLEEARYKQMIGPSCCWLMITADKTLETVMGTAEAQPDAYLLKPVTEVVLLSRIRRMKARKEAFNDIDLAMMAHDYYRAISICEQRAATDKANAVDLLRLKCELLIHVGQTDQARGFYEKMLATRDQPWAQLGLAKIHLQLGEYDVTCELLEQLITRSRNYLEAYDCLAQTYRRLKQGEKAEHILERALALSPLSHARQRAMGETALTNNKHERAEKAFRMAIQLGEFSVHKSTDSYLGLAKALSARGNSAEALNTLDKMVKVFDSEETKLLSKSVECRILVDNGDLPRAQQQAEEIVQLLNRGNVGHLGPVATRDMAETLLMLGQRDKAIELLRSEILNNPDDPANIEAVRQIFQKQGLCDEGNEMVEATRAQAVEMMNSSVLLSRSGDFSHAIAKMRQALEIMPRNVRLLLNAAHLLISHIEKTGADPALIREARRHLLTANACAPGEPRFSDLMSRLETINASTLAKAS
ncbi:response regulator [Azonexus sp.]|uniref:response regulator n=1 Tax=Azonexus sp. TaxID=1872668 RepID=UPI0027B8E621|nr:response regulator [Azonexus sp.]